MKMLLYQMMKWIRRQGWALIVAYMLGIHNFYRGEDKNRDDIVITIEHREEQLNGTPTK